MPKPDEINLTSGFLAETEDQEASTPKFTLEATVFLCPAVYSRSIFDLMGNTLPLFSLSLPAPFPFLLPRPPSFLFKFF